MEKGLITLSARELERLRIVSKVMDRNMTQMEASCAGSARFGQMSAFYKL